MSAGIYWRGCALAALALAARGWSQQQQSLTQQSFTRDGEYLVETTTGSIPVDGINRLRVRVRGDVNLTADISRRVSFNYQRRVRARNEVEVRALLATRQLRLLRQADSLVATLSDVSYSPIEGQLTISVPSTLQSCIIETYQGDVEAVNLGGEITLQTTAGKILADRLRGSLAASTGSGEVQVGTVEGSARCVSGGGIVRVSRIGGEAWLETAGGDVMVDTAGGPLHVSTGAGNIDVRRGASTVSARTMGGLIHIAEAGGAVVAESGGGGIQVGEARGVRCESAGGPIKLSGVSGQLYASTAIGNILAELVAGKTLLDSYLETGSGDITVMIPSNLSVQVQAWNEASTRPGWIVSDFPEIRVEPYRKAGPFRTVAQGRLNGGGPLLKVAATGGTIYLRRMK